MRTRKVLGWHQKTRFFIRIILLHLKIVLNETFSSILRKLSSCLPWARKGRSEAEKTLHLKKVFKMMTPMLHLKIRYDISISSAQKSFWLTFARKWGLRFNILYSKIKQLLPLSLETKGTDIRTTPSFLEANASRFLQHPAQKHDWTQISSLSRGAPKHFPTGRLLAGRRNVRESYQNPRDIRED